jgi:tripartite-type tricarboxylate transporter receptor subunit TctC
LSLWSRPGRSLWSRKMKKIFTATLGRPVSLAFVVSMLQWGTAAVAQSSNVDRFPDRPVKLIVPKSPGGPVDAFARLVANELGRIWHQPVVIENQAGASGTIGSQEVARSVADGYTLLFTDVTSQVTAPLLAHPRPYDSVKDFEPIAMVSQNLLVLVVNSALPVKTIDELVAYAKQHPDKLNFSTAGVGGFAHLTMTLLLNRLGLDIVHVAYRGGAPALLAVVAGDVQLNIADLASALPLMNAGKIRAIAQIGQKRSPLLPDVPTIAEAGVSNFEGTYWVGLLAPKNTPAAVVDKINRDVNSALASPEIVNSARKAGAEIVGGTAQAFANVIARDGKTWEAVIQKNNIHAD